MDDAWVIVRSDQVVEYLTTAAAELLGLPSEQVLGAALANLLATDGAHSSSGWSAFLRRQPATLCCTTCQSPARELRAEVSVLQGPDERWLVGLRPAAEPQPERLLEALLRSPEVQCAYLDEELRFVRVSDAYARTVGINGPQLRGHKHFELFPHAENERLFAQPLHTNEPVTVRAKRFEHPRQLERGATYWDWTASPVRDAQGRPRGVLVCLLDVTERVQLESSLANEQRFLRAVMDDALTGLCVTSADKVLFQNRRCTETLGELCDPHDLWMRVQTHDGQSLRWHALSQLDTSWTGPIACHTAAGLEPRELLAHMRPVTFEEQPAILCVLEDVSVLERLRRRLLRSQKLELLGGMLTRVAHDFGNLLTVLAFDAARGMQPGANPAKIEEALSRVREGTERAQRLVQRILSFAGEPARSVPVVDVNRALEELVPVLETALGDRGLSLGRSQGELYARMDPIHFEQVLLNLVLNARDATEADGHVDIQVSRRGTGRLELRVQDDGPGIPPDLRDRIFEPFFSTKQDGRGSGVGLAVVAELVQRAGGRVEVGAGEPHGALFTVDLPVESESRASGSPPPPVGDVYGTEEVLICEPQADLRNAMLRGLRLLGYTTSEAIDFDGLRTLALHRRGSAWIVAEQLIVGRTPEQVEVELGIEVAPLVCVATSLNAPDLSAWRTRVPLQIVRKPFTPLDLARALRRVIDSSSPQ